MANDSDPLRGEERRLPKDASSGAAGRTILLVEDDAHIRSLASRVLAQQGYTLVQASNGSEALDVIRKHDLQIDLVITDVKMSLVTGPELLRRLLPIRPGIKAIFVTGSDSGDLPKGSGIVYLEKPFTLRSLVFKVQEALDEHQYPP